MKQYYSMLSTNPSELYRFYADDSSFCHTSHANEAAKVVKGVENIRERIAQLGKFFFSFCFNTTSLTR